MGGAWHLGAGRVPGVSTMATTVTLASGPDAAARWAPPHRSSECLGVLPLAQAVPSHVGRQLLEDMPTMSFTLGSPV